MQKSKNLMRFWIKKLELPGRVDFNRVESHAGSAYPIPNKRKQKKRHVIVR